MRAFFLIPIFILLAAPVMAAERPPLIELRLGGGTDKIQNSTFSSVEFGGGLHPGQVMGGAHTFRPFAELQAENVDLKAKHVWVWMRFLNPSQKPMRRMISLASLAHGLQAWEKRDGEWHLIKAIDLLSDGVFEGAASPDLFFRYEFPPGEKEILLAVGTFTTRIFGIAVHDIQSYWKSVFAVNFVMAMVSLIAALFMVYNLVLFGVMRERKYLIYGVYTFLFTVFVLLRGKYFGAWFGFQPTFLNSSGGIALRFIYSALLFSVYIFLLDILELKRERLIFSWLAYFGMFMTTIPVTLYLFHPAGASSLIFGLVPLTAMLVFGIPIGQFFFGRNRVAPLWNLGAKGLMALGALLEYFRLTGFLDSDFRFFAPIGFILELTVLTGFMSMSAFRLRQENLSSKAALLESLKREQEATEKHARELEEQVTERTTELRTALQELEELSATKNRFFSIVAHDLRAPFMTILNTTEIVTSAEGGLKQEEIHDFLQELHNISQRTYDFLENLLQWASLQMDQIKMEPIRLNVAAVARDVCKFLGETANQKKIKLAVEMADEIFVFADWGGVHTIFRNLIGNAIKFSREGGGISISSVEENGTQKLTVRDEGVGMDDSTLSLLFKLNHKISTIGTAGERGTGLGLILCKEFIERSGGRIWVDSVPGEGSAFHFTLPTTR